jgi:pilus assembly protein CpaB
MNRSMNRRWIVPVVAIVLATFTTAVIIGYLQQARRVAPQAVEMAPVLVAKADILAGTVVAADKIEVRQIPASAIHTRAFRSADGVAGHVAVVPIFADEQVLSTMIASGETGSGLAYLLPKGMRAVTIPANEVSEVAGFVAPGDRVDIVGTVSQGNSSVSKIFLQNVLVIAVAQQADQKSGQAPKISTSITVALSPKEVEMLTQVDTSGRIRLALRPAGVPTQVQTSGETTDAALGLSAPAAPVQRSVSVVYRTTAAPAPAPQPGVEIWRATDKSTVHP